MITTRRLDLPGADVVLIERAFPATEAQALMHTLAASIPWRQDHITLFGRTHPVPRLHQWFADEGRVYTWSGIAMTPAPWPAEMDVVRARVCELADHPFDSALANLYRTGRDTVRWHADDEPVLGPEPVIASVSLGARRDFAFRPRAGGPTTTLALPSGSVLIMRGTTQQHYKHQLPRRTRVTEPRINLTFRRMAAPV